MKSNVSLLVSGGEGVRMIGVYIGNDGRNYVDQKVQVEWGLEMWELLIKPY